MEPSPDPRRDEFDFEWCLSVEDVRALYNIICYSICLLYTSPSPRDKRQSRMPSSA